MPQVAAAAVFAAVGTAASSFAAGGFAAAAGVSFVAAGIANVSIAAVVVSGVLGAAAAGLQLAMAKKPGGAPAGPGVSIAQPTPVLEDVYGRTRVGGYFAFFRETETNKKRNISAVIVLAAHEIDAVEEVWFDDKLGVSGNLIRPEFIDRIAAFEVRLGAPGQSPPTSLISAQSGIVNGNFKLTGKPYIYVELRDVKKKWPKGMPSIWAVVRGKKVPDPRTGQTAWTDNWALICADYVKTRGKLKAEYIKDAGLIAAANLCDEMVDGHKRYTFNGKIATNRPARDVLPEMRRYAVADTVWLGDEFLILPGAYSAPVRTFTKRDFKSAITLTSEALVEDRWDRVEGTYGPVASYYNPTGIGGLTFDDYNPAQGDPRVLQIDLPNEQVHVRGQRCIFLAAKQTRRQRGAKFAIAPTPENLALLPYQRVVLDYPEVGLSGVWQLRTLPTLLDSERPRIEVEVLEDGPDFWSWGGELATAAPPSQSTSLPNPFTVQPVTAPVVATPRVRIEPDGSTTRWIEVTWGESDDFYLREYEVQWVQNGVTRTQRVPSTRFDILNVSANQVVSITVYAINTFGLASTGLSPGSSSTPLPDTTSPGVPLLLDFRGAVGRVNFTVRGPADLDLANIRLYEAAAGGAFSTATEVLRVPCAPNGRVEFSRDNMAYGVTRRFWLTAADRTGNESGVVGPIEATPRKLIAEEIGDALITPTMFTQETLDIIGGSGAAATAAAEAARDAALGARDTALAAAQDATDIALGLESSVDLARDAAEAARDAALGAADVAEEASFLAAQLGSGSVIEDTRFRDYGAASWVRWNGTNGAAATVTLTGQPGGQAVTLVCAADQQVGLLLSSTSATWSGVKNADAFVVEVDATLNTGSLAGAGVLLDWRTGATFRASVLFSAMRASGTGRVRYQAVMRCPADFTGVFSQHDLYLVANSTALGALAAKSITIHECRIRPATAEELGTGQVGAAITTAVSAETTNRNIAIAAEGVARTAAITAAKSEITGGSTRTLAQVDGDQATKVTESQAQAAAGTRIASELQTGGAIKGAIDASANAIKGGSTRTLAQVDGDQATKVTATQADARADTRISAQLLTGGTIKGAIDASANAIRGGSTRTLAQIDADQATKVTAAQADARADSRISASFTSGLARTELDKSSAALAVESFTDPVFSRWGEAGTASATRWAGQGTLTTPASAYFPAGRTLRFSVTAAQADGLEVRSNYVSWRGVRDAAGFAIDLQYDLTGAAGLDILAIWYNTLGQAFGSSAQVSAVRQGEAGAPARAQWLARRPVGFVGTFSFVNVWVLINWNAVGGTGSPVGAGTVEVHRLGIRPATAEEIGAGAVGDAITVALNAEITNRQAAIAAEGVARTAAIAAAKSEITGGSTVTIAQQQTVIGTKVDANGAIAAVDGRVATASGGEYASVQEMTAAQTLLDQQARAFKYVRVDVNGNVATSFIGASDDGSDISFAADRFTINGESVFQVDGGVVRMGDARVKRLSIGEQEVDLSRMEVDSSVTLWIANRGFSPWNSSRVTHLDLWFFAKSRGAYVEPLVWFQTTQGSFAQGATRIDYVLEVLLNGNVSSGARLHTFSPISYFDSQAFLSEYTTQIHQMKHRPIYANPGWNVLRLHFDWSRVDLSFTELYALVFNR